MSIANILIDHFGVWSQGYYVIVLDLLDFLYFFVNR